MAALDVSSDNKMPGDKKLKRPVHLVSLVETEQRIQTQLLPVPRSREADKLHTDDLLEHAPEQKVMKQLPVESELKVADKLKSPFFVLNAWHYDEQSTWIVPAIQSPNKASRLETRDVGSQDYISLMRNLLKSSGIYALASVATPLVSLVLAPFLTRSLPRTDYGALAVLNTIIALMAGITQLGLSSAFFRAYNYDYDSKEDRRGIFSTVIFLLSLTSIITATTAMLIAPWIAESLFNNLSYSQAVRCAALVVLLQNLTVPGFAWMRSENRAGLFSLLAIINLVITLSSTVVLVGVLDMGIEGALLATGSGYAFIALCTLPVILVRSGLRPRMDIARNLLSFGIPLVFNFVSYWVLQLSDRYLLSRFGSLSQTASYAVAYSLGGMLSVVILSPFILAWPSAMFAIAKRDDAAQIFRLVFRWFSIVLLLAAFAFSLISIVVLDVLFPPAYHSAAPVIPIIAFSLMFYGIYNVFAVGVGVQRKTWLTAIFMTLSALVNVGFNIVLIPRYGSIGAATSTLIAYAFLALISYLANQRIYPIPFEIGKFLLALPVGIAIYIGSGIMAQTQGIFGFWAIYLSMFILYAGCLLLFGKLLPWQQKNRNNGVKEVSFS